MWVSIPTPGGNYLCPFFRLLPSHPRDRDCMAISAEDHWYILEWELRPERK
jgi:hypothetical protein